MPKPRSCLTLHLAAAVGALLLCRTGHANSDEYLIDVWDNEKGLPSSSVTSLAQTPEGYLWAGTQNGLVRFDGVRFVTFDPSSTPELRHARVDALFLDESGRLWINTHDGSLTSWREGRFQHEWTGKGGVESGAWRLPTRAGETAFLLETGEVIRRADTGEAGETWLRVRAPGAVLSSVFCQDGSGVLWIRSNDERLWRLTGGKLDEVPWTRGLAGRAIRHLAADQSGRLWLASDREMASWQGTCFRAMMPLNGPRHADVTFLLFPRKGSNWAVADGRARPFGQRRWTTRPRAMRGLTGFVRLAFEGYEDRSGGVWFAHYGKGLFHVRPGGAGHRITMADGLPGERVRAWLQDREGNVWVGVDHGGLVRLRERRLKVLGPTEGLAAKAAVSICEDRHGAIWIGTLDGGLTRWRAGALARFSPKRTTSGGSVFSVYPDREDRLWISLDQEDLALFTHGRFMPAPTPVHGVKAMLVDRENRLWLGCKQGLSCWARGRLRQFGPEQGIDRQDVRALAEDSQGAIWIGSGDGSVYRMHDDRATVFRARDSAASAAVWSLLPDEDGTLWVGTFRGGLLRLRSGQFTRYTTQQGLPSDVICQLLDDGQGRLWVGSHRGIFYIAKAAIEAFSRGELGAIPCVAYGRSDGLPTLECSGNYQPSAWRGRDGRLWFATTRGVVSVQPREVPLDTLAPSVFIEDVLVGREPRAVPRTGGTVEIPPGQRSVELRFTSVRLTAPEQIHSRHRLEGLERDWVEAGSRRSAQYSYLRPGEYRFHVVACGGGGVCDQEGASLVLRVLPRFWETRWFMVLAGLLSATALAATVRYLVTSRLRGELHRMERQRAIERDRVRIAEDIHDDLGAGLTQITLLSELARSDAPQEAEAHLGQISDTARELTRAMDEIVWAVNPHNDTLDSLMDYLCKFAQEYLSVAGIQCRLAVPAQVPRQLVRAEVRHNLFLAVKEALHNVIKHARASEVRLRLEASRKGLTLVIEDNGHGFVIQPGSNEQRAGDRLSSGHGLRNQVRRLAAIGGSCVVESAVGRGTRVEMKVGLG